MDNIKSPNHYKLSGLKVESIDVVKAVLGRDGFSAFCHGNVLKYLIRARKKNGVEDLKKAKVYLEWMIENLGGERETPKQECKQDRRKN